jgi:hypothetical protein
MEPKELLDLFENYILDYVEKHPEMKADLEIEIDLNNPDAAACVVYKPLEWPDISMNAGGKGGLFTIVTGTKLFKVVAQKLKDAYLDRFSYSIHDIMINLVGVTGKTVPFHFLEAATRSNASKPDNVELTFKGSGPYSTYTIQITITIDDRDRLASTIANL